MLVKMAARTLLESLVGKPILTVTGRPNTVLRVEGDSVVVGHEPLAGGSAGADGMGAEPS